MNLESVFGIAANAVTIIGFIVVNYQFLQWRKQQRYSIELSTLLDIGDQFELFIHSHMNINALVLEMNKAEKNTKPPKEKEDNDKYRQDKFLISLQKISVEHAEIEKSYSLLLFRGKRLKLWQETPQDLDAAYIGKKFNTLVDDKSSLEETAAVTSKIKEAAYHELEKIKSKYI